MGIWGYTLRLWIFNKNLKIGLSPIGKMYIVCALLHNARACLYKNITTNVFDVETPRL